MSRYGYRSHGYGSEIGGNLVAIGLIIVCIAVIVFLAGSYFIIKTFMRYRKVSRALWVSLWVAIACIVLGTLLAAFINQNFTELHAFAWVEMLVVSIVVKRQQSQTLMRPQVNVIDEMRQYAWWRKHGTSSAV